jgi:hypothetical protein
MQPPLDIEQFGTQNVLDVSDRPVIIFSGVPLTQQPIIPKVPTQTATVCLSVCLLGYALLPVIELPVRPIRLEPVLIKVLDVPT